GNHGGPAQLPDHLPRPMLERYLHPHAQAADEAGDGAVGQGRFRSRGYVGALIVHVFELQLDGVVEIPVQAAGETVQDAALDALRAGTIVEVDVGVSCSQFPGAPTPVENATIVVPGNPGVGERALAAEVITRQSADFLVITAALAGQNV